MAERQSRRREKFRPGIEVAAISDTGTGYKSWETAEPPQRISAQRFPAKAILPLARTPTKGKKDDNPEKNNITTPAKKNSMIISLSSRQTAP
jgi:hypothetical protein